LIEEYLRQHPRGEGARILDLGCGEGKNAAAFARAGYAVEAIDCSRLALTNGKRAFPWMAIHWLQADAREISFEPALFDVIVAYGLFHCLASSAEISSLIDQMKRVTKPGSPPGVRVQRSFA
jgi:ubiquinone/menaquinone biosynthesis C-methylase UbiE